MPLREKLLRVAPEEWENEFVRIRPMTTRDDLIYAGDGCRLTDEQREFVNPVWFSLGRAYLAPEDAAAGTEVEVEVRGRRIPCKVVELPFYKR